jgi:hypothetical protein
LRPAVEDDIDGDIEEQGSRGVEANEIQDIPVMGDHIVEDKEYGKNGVYVLPSGTSCTGPFLRTGLSGHGSLARPDGCSYTGQFNRGRMNGFGHFTWNDGRSYVGQYKINLKEGEGEFTWPDGRSYKGQWVAGRQDGLGIFTTAKGEKREGVWTGGKIEWLPARDLPPKEVRDTAGSSAPRAAAAKHGSAQDDEDATVI